MDKWYEYIQNYPIGNIIISEDFAKTKPNRRKIQSKKAKINNGDVGAIVINKNNILQDGYITYLILKDKDIENVDIMVNLGERTNSYKLKNNVTKEYLLDLGFKEGSWQSEYKNIHCVSKNIQLIESIELHITIRTNPMSFNDFEDVLVLDEDFCQPYAPFYGKNYKKLNDDYGYLQKVISRYNQAMDLQGVFEKSE